MIRFFAARGCTSLVGSRCFSSVVVRRALVASSVFVPSTSAPLLISKRLKSIRNDNSPEGRTEDADEYIFDASTLVQREAAEAGAENNLEKILSSWLPEYAPDAAIDKVKAYLAKNPVDELILSPTVQVTHIEDESGEEKKVSNLSPMTLKEAIENARERGISVVQMAERDGVAFVRIRNEKKRVLEMIAQELSSLESSTPAQPQVNLRLKNNIDHIFRDAVDDHFVGWKSKKIVDDMKKLHPVKIGIQQFQSADTAVSKLRQMANAIKTQAESLGVWHHFTSMNASDKEVSVLFSPSIQGKANASKQVKHPSEKEWNNLVSRLEGALGKSGRMGTYMKMNDLKPRNVGATPYRVDKYGRRIA